MAYQYSTRLSNLFADVLLTTLQEGQGKPLLNIFDGGGVLLASLPFETSMLKDRTPSFIELSNPSPALALKDAEATSATLVNGNGEDVVTFGVGSETTNPDAELILSSTTIYKGGTVIVNSVKLLI